MRIRSIKPEFWRSLDIANLDWYSRLIFIGLWSYVDDNGVGLDRPALIAADLFAEDLSRDPRDTLARLARGLDEIAAADLITRYSVENKDYLHVNNWDKHQRIDRPNKPRYPLPTSENANTRDTLATPSRVLRESPATGTGEQGNRVTGEQILGGEVASNGTDSARARLLAPSNFSQENDWRALTGGLATDPTGTPAEWSLDSDPRCREHAHLPRSLVPKCPDCKQARLWFEYQKKCFKQAKRAEIEACDLCDERGMIAGHDENDRPIAWRCDHITGQKPAPDAP